MKNIFHTKPGQSNTPLDDSGIPEPLAGISPRAREALERLAPHSLPGAAPEAKPVNRSERRLVQAVKRQAPKLPPAERKARKRKAAERRERRRLEKLRKKISVYAPNADPTLIPEATWILGKQLLALPVASFVTAELRRMKNKVFAGLVRHAALGLQPDGTYRYSWEHPRARAIAAFGIAIFQTATRVYTATGKKRYVCAGVPLAAWQRFLADPWTGTQPGEKTVGKGRHRPGGCLADGQIGYLRALQEAGAVYAQKIKPSDARPHEKAGPSGFACLRYWVVSPDPERSISDAEKVRLREVRETEKALQKAELARETALTVHTATELDQASARAGSGAAPEPRPPP